MRKTVDTIDPYLKNDNKIVSEINRISDSELLKMNTLSYSNNLSNKYKISVPILGDDKTKISSKILERYVLKSRIPNGVRYDSYEDTIKMEVCQYKIPFQGDLKLFPIKFVGTNLYDFSIENQELIVEIISFKKLTDNDDNKKEMKKLFLEFYDKLEETFNKLKITVDSYNEKLQIKIENFLITQIEKINNQNKNNNDLNPFLS